MRSWVLCGLILLYGASAHAQQPRSLQAELGFAGFWKLGQVCPVKVTLSAELRSRAESVSIATIDGDGVEVVYRQRLEPAASSVGASVWVPIRIGRLNAPLVVRASDREGVLEELRLTKPNMGKGLASDQAMIVALGNSMGVEQLSRSNADGSSATFATAVLTAAEQLPYLGRDYQSADLIIISCSDTEFLANVQPRQWSAVDAWIRSGGGCVITLGTPKESLPSDLLKMLPGEIAGQSTINNPGAVESLVASVDDPLQAFPASRIELQRGHVVLSIADSFGRDLPWWISCAHGHGTIQVVASPLDLPAFANWKDRKRLWEQLIASYLDREMLEPKKESRAGDSSYLGYDDLVGQLRATLDVFSSVRVVSFGQFAAVLIGILILIGPIDYFVSVKWLGRPHLSWVFAGTCLLGICGGLTWFYHSVRPDELHINSAQIVDINAATGDVNGRIWSHVYSGSARTVNIVMRPTTHDPVFVDWQGLPGRGLGGLLSELNADRGMPGYAIQVAADGGSSVEEVGIPAAGTKCIVGSWTSQVDLTAQSKLVEIPGVEQLSGEFVNPLDVDLKEPSLLYHNWYYSLNSRIAPGERVAITYDTIPKDASRRLNRRHTVEGSNVITPWDPADRGSLDRLLEMMMFHKAASGRSYTSLTHRYQPQIDHSNLMETDQAILIGRVDDPWASVELSLTEDASGNVPVIRDIDRIWCRIIIPVARVQQQ